MESPRKLMIIINPHAGVVATQGADKLIAEEAHKLVYCNPGEPQWKHAYDIDLRLTERAGHAAELAREAVEKGYYGVVACGGDGTVNEAASGVCGSKTALGVIPLGSGNGLARHLGVPMTVRGAMKVIGEDRILNADYATANGRPFFCTFGVGFDAEVTEKFNNRPGRGLNNYIRTVMEEYFSYKSETYTIIANGRMLTERALLVAVCNASQYGNNAYIAPHASIKDGMLDITILHHGNLITDSLTMLDMLTGLTDKSPDTTTFRASQLKIIRNVEGAVHFDGEPASLPREINVECHPGCLRLFSTARKSRMRALMAPEIPIISPIVLTMRDLRFKVYNLFQPKK
ncbi:MAG: diacylglycerol kinase family lipid kinase [Bacteroides sp.]|nr:diacylglycerol kinase family lipid kinase [Bacteroides sp.]MBD5371081.1 diacylglycerol kinase family lipid kinase [Bacteroides sp.]